MQQRQPRLGDILDDYCPRERRLTNHVVVAMVGDEVKQTRCTTCDADHEYKHAKVPRQRRKESPAGLTAQVLASAPKRVTPEPAAVAHADVVDSTVEAMPLGADPEAPMVAGPAPDSLFPFDADQNDELEEREEGEEDTAGPVEAEGPAHRRLIRATLPRTENTPPLTRQAPDFTIRQPTGGRPNRFRPRPPQRPGQSFQGNRSSGQPGGGQPRGGGMPRHGHGGGRPAGTPRPARRHDGGGRKGSK
jgi:hypothetical protein